MKMATCQCVLNHNPMPMAYQVHHVVPQSWMRKGAQPSSTETVTLCGTAHDSVHDLLNQYVKHGGPPPWPVRRQYGDYIRKLAATAWDLRPNDKPPYTTSKGKL
jgi:hypothetical protein